ncbi:MAG: hypothetical protein H7A46_12055 [Verrucomicrobiales bacterium]|nr:hypothetical protein [Verrucomicrobiales bacterium]
MKPPALPWQSSEALVARTARGFACTQASRPESGFRSSRPLLRLWVDGVALAIACLGTGSAQESGDTGDGPSETPPIVQRGSWPGFLRGENEGFARRVQVVGDLAYLADDGIGLQIIDVSDPDHPEWLGTFNTAWGPYAVQVVGNTAYLAAFLAGLQIVDVSDPSSPKLVSQQYFGFEHMDVCVAGNLAYVASFGSGLYILDVSDPANPTSTGRYNPGFPAISVSVAGNRAYVGAGGLEILDVTAPASPVLLGEGYGGIARDVEVVGSLAYVATYYGLTVYDVSDPTKPDWLYPHNRYDPYFRTARGVQVVGNLAYVASDEGGLLVVDVSDPRQLSPAGGYDTDGTAYDVQIVGNLAYVADGENGLVILELPFPAILTDRDNFGVIGSEFGFSVGGRAGKTVIVEGSIDLQQWLPLETHTMGDAPWRFNDPEWEQFPGRFYRVRLE